MALVQLQPHEPDSFPATTQDTFEGDFTPQNERQERYDDASFFNLNRRGVTSHHFPSPDAPKPASTRSSNPDRKPQQRVFRNLDNDAFRQTITSKLKSVGRHDLAMPLERCHTEVTRMQCLACKSVSQFWNRCELKHCPICQRRLAHEKRQSIEWWTERFLQPKHVVLTSRNSEQLTKAEVKRFKAAFAKLRRTKFATESKDIQTGCEYPSRKPIITKHRIWLGGHYHLEVTNEGKGWHLHLHAIVECVFIDVKELARVWGRCIGQSFGIVCIKDVREKSYLNEVCKYAVKGSQMAKWSGEEIAEFIDAFEGVKTWGCFGQLYALRGQHKAFIDSLQAEKPACSCGCEHFKMFNEDEWEWHEATSAGIPPPQLPKVITPYVDQFAFTL